MSHYINTDGTASSFRYPSYRSSVYKRRLQYSMSRDTTAGLEESLRGVGSESTLVSSTKTSSFLWRALKKCQTWMRWSDDEDDDEDLEDAPECSKMPPPMSVLIEETNFTKRFIMFMYRNFKQRAPNGRLSQKEWRKLMLILFPRSVGFVYTDRLFFYLSKSNQGPPPFISFETLLRFLHTLEYDDHSLSTFVFALLEPDEQGRVSQKAFVDYVQAVFMLREGRRIVDENGNSNTSLPARSIRHFAIIRFKALDTDSDGFVVFEDVQRLLAELRMTSLHNVVLPTTPKTPVDIQFTLTSPHPMSNDDHSDTIEDEITYDSSIERTPINMRR